MTIIFEPHITASDQALFHKIFMLAQEKNAVALQSFIDSGPNINFHCGIHSVPSYLALIGADEVIEWLVKVCDVNEKELVMGYSMAGNVEKIKPFLDANNHLVEKNKAFAVYGFALSGYESYVNELLSDGNNRIEAFSAYAHVKNFDAIKRLIETSPYTSLELDAIAEELGLINCQEKLDELINEFPQLKDLMLQKFMHGLAVGGKLHEVNQILKTNPTFNASMIFMNIINAFAFGRRPDLIVQFCKDNSFDSFLENDLSAVELSGLNAGRHDDLLLQLFQDKFKPTKEFINMFFTFCIRQENFSLLPKLFFLCKRLDIEYEMCLKEAIVILDLNTGLNGMTQKEMEKFYISAFGKTSYLHPERDFLDQCKKYYRGSAANIDMEKVSNVFLMKKYNLDDNKAKNWYGDERRAMMIELTKFFKTQCIPLEICILIGAYYFEKSYSETKKLYDRFRLTNAKQLTGFFISTANFFGESDRKSFEDKLRKAVDRKGLISVLQEVQTKNRNLNENERKFTVSIERIKSRL